MPAGRPSAASAEKRSFPGKVLLTRRSTSDMPITFTFDSSRCPISATTAWGKRSEVATPQAVNPAPGLVIQLRASGSVQEIRELMHAGSLAPRPSPCGAGHRFFASGRSAPRDGQRSSNDRRNRLWAAARRSSPAERHGLRRGLAGPASSTVTGSTGSRGAGAVAAGGEGRGAGAGEDTVGPGTVGGGTGTTAAGAEVVGRCTGVEAAGAAGDCPGAGVACAGPGRGGSTAGGCATGGAGGGFGLYFSGNRIGSHSGWNLRFAISACRNAGSFAWGMNRCMIGRRISLGPLSHISTSA